MTDRSGAASPPITQEAIRAALASIRNPATPTPLTDLAAVKLRLTRPGQREPPTPLAALHEVLLDAMAQLRVEAAGEPGVLRRHYAQGKDVKAIWREMSMSDSTYYRRQREELAELTGIVMRMNEEAESQLAMLPHARPALASQPPECFVGREAQIAQAKALLSGPGAAKTIALVGLAGAGKSALATVLAHDPDVLALFPDGVLWADVGQEGDIASCLAEWTRALRIASPASPAIAIRNHLAQRRMLIVLDDVWSIEDASALTVGGAGCAHIITTNARALAHIVALDRVVEVGELDEASARALLRWYLPDHVLAQAVPDPALLDRVNVTRRFGDLPLEIIRAAHDLRSLAASGQTQRLIDFLTAADASMAPRPYQRVGGELMLTPDAPEAHMKQRIERSLALLPPEILTALGALTVFDPKPNTFREADAVAVAACDRATLFALVDAGLIELRHGRYTMHRSIWHVVRQQAAAPEGRARLAQHFAAALNGDDKLALSPADARNIRRALEAAQGLGLNDAFAQIANGAFLVFDQPGEHAFLEHALMRIEGMDGARGLSAPVLARLGRLRLVEGRMAEARALSQEAVQLAEAADDSDAAILAMQTLADIEMDSPDEPESDVLGRALRVRATVRDEQTMMRAGSETVRRHLLKGQLAQVRRFLVRTVPDELEEQSARAPNLALAFTAKGWFEWLYGRVDQAQARLTRMMARSGERQYRMPYLFAVGALSWLTYQRADYDRALTLANELLTAPDRDVVPDFVACAYNARGLRAAEQGDIATAMDALDRGVGYALMHESKAIAASLNVSRARAWLAEGALAKAEAAAALARQQAREGDGASIECLAIVMQATICAACGEAARAADLFATAREYVTHQGVDEAWTCLFYARRHGAFMALHGDFATGWQMLEDLLPWSRSLHTPDDEAEILFALAEASLHVGERERARRLAFASLEIHHRLGHRGAIRTSTWLAKGGLGEPKT